MTILKLRPTRQTGLVVLIDRTSAGGDLSVCVQSALSTLVALASGAGELDRIDEGRVQAAAAGDDQLANLLRQALEELEYELAELDRPDEPGDDAGPFFAA